MALAYDLEKNVTGTKTVKSIK